MKTSPNRISVKAGGHRAEESIGVSITSEHGQQFRYQAQAVSLRMTGGVLQIVERARGCFAWFKGCKLEIRDRRHNVLFRLRSGSASNDGTDLTIVAEIARSPDGVAKTEPADDVLARVSAGAARKRKTAARRNSR